MRNIQYKKWCTQPSVVHYQFSDINAKAMKPL
jgi:hypothetical protein